MVRMKKTPQLQLQLPIVLSALILSTPLLAKQNHSLVDRYTKINNVETFAQANPLNVVISTKFAKSIITVKQAIEELLIQSGYTLNSNYEAERIGNFALPKVHREIGPIPLKRAIKVILGKAWDIQINETTRSIQIVQADSEVLQVLTPDSKALIENVVETGVLDEIVAVSIKDTLLVDALKKVLPVGWAIQLEDSTATLARKTVTVTSEDHNRETVIKQVLADIDADMQVQGFFFEKLKLLVVRSNQKVIK